MSFNRVFTCLFLHRLKIHGGNNRLYVNTEVKSRAAVFSRLSFRMNWNFTSNIFVRDSNVQTKKFFTPLYNLSFSYRTDIVVNYTYFFYKQPVYKQLVVEWQIAKQLSGLNLLSPSANKNYIQRKEEFFFYNKRKILVKMTMYQDSQKY